MEISTCFGQEDKEEYKFDVLNQYQFNEDENSEFRYIKFRVTSKYDYTHQQAKEDMEYWTRKEAQISG